MNRVFAIVLLLLAPRLADGAQGPRLTRAEGAVVAEARLLRTDAGRASTRLADGSVIDLDADTTLSFLAPDLLEMSRGRALVRTGRFGPLRLSMPVATIRLAPDGAYAILMDHREARLLVQVERGQADITTRYGSTTPVLTGQQAMMTGATGLPWAAGYARVGPDAFSAWAARGDGPSPWRGDEPWYDDRPAPGIEPPDREAGPSTSWDADSGVTNGGWPGVWGCVGPCWAVPGGPVRGRPGFRRGRGPVPEGWTEHPDFVPTYTPDFERPLPHRPGSRPDRRSSGPRERGGPPPAVTPAPAPSSRPRPGPGVRLPAGTPPGAPAPGRARPRR